MSVCLSVCVQCVVQAVTSIQSTYQQRAAKAEDWRATQMLSLLSDSNKIMMVAHTDSVCISHFAVHQFHFISFMPWLHVKKVVSKLF